MTILSQTDFSLGEIAPRCHAEPALARRGLKTCVNLLHGDTLGLHNRPGTDLVGWAPCANPSAGTARTNALIPFPLGPEIEIPLEFGDKTARPVSGGAYVTDLTFTISKIETDTALFGVRCWKVTLSQDAEAAGVAEGDLVKVVLNGVWTDSREFQNLDGRTVSVLSASATALYLDPSPLAIAADQAQVGILSGKIHRIHQFDTPYLSSDLDEVQGSQPAEPGDVLWTARRGYPIQRIQRNSDTSWTMGPQVIAPSVATPTNLAFEGGPATGVAREYVVTRVDKNAVESLPQSGAAIIGLASKPAEQSPVGLQWDATTARKFYNVYARDRGREFGLIGRTESESGFYDNGIDPDYTQTPPMARDPFTMTTKELKSGTGIVPTPAGATCEALSHDGLTIAFGAAVNPYMYVYHRLTVESAWVPVVPNITLQYLFPWQTEGSGGDENGIYNFQLVVPLNGTINDLCFSPDDKWLVIVGDFTGKQLAGTTGDPNWPLTSNVGGNHIRAFNVEGIDTAPYVTVGDVKLGDEPIYETADQFFAALNAMLPGPRIIYLINKCRTLEKSYMQAGASYTGRRLANNRALTHGGPAFKLRSVCFSPNGSHLLAVGSGEKVNLFKWEPVVQAVRQNWWLTYWSFQVKTFQPGGTGGRGLHCRYLPSESKLAIMSDSAAPGAWELNLYDHVLDVYTKDADEPDVQPTQEPTFLSVRPTGDVIISTCLAPPYLEWWIVDGDDVVKQPPVTEPDGAAHGSAWTPDGAWLAVFHDAGGVGNLGFSLYKYDEGAKTLTKQDDPSNPSLFQVTMYRGQWTSNGTEMYIVMEGAVSACAFAYVEVKVYPRCIAHAQGRMLTAAPDSEQATIKGSVTGDYPNFSDRMVMRPTDSFDLKLAGQNTSIRRLVAAGNYLLTLNAGSAYAIAWPGDGAIDATQIPAARLQSQHGIGNAPPVVDGSGVVYASGEEIHELRYRLDAQAFEPRVLNALAYHMFRGRRVVSAALVRRPEAAVWWVMDDGTMRYMRDDRRNGTIFWSRYETDGEVKDLTVVREGDRDAVYLLVDRLVNGIESRLLERMSERRYDAFETGAAFLDSALTFDGRNTAGYLLTAASAPSGSGYLVTITSADPALTGDDIGAVIVFTTSTGTRSVTVAGVYEGGGCMTAYCIEAEDLPDELKGAGTTAWYKKRRTLSGLGHLEGREVGVFADGYVAASPLNPDFADAALTVAQGKITLPKAYCVIRVGIPYRWDLETTGTNDPRYPRGMEKQKSVDRAIAQVEDTRGFWAGHAAPAADALAAGEFQKCRTMEGRQDLFDTPASNEAGAVIQPIGGLVKCPLKQEYDEHGRVYLCGTDPVPFQLASLHPAGLIT